MDEDQPNADHIRIGAIRSRMINALVTDVKTALHILDHLVTDPQKR